jgi:hypothetical protein
MKASEITEKLKSPKKFVTVQELARQMEVRSENTPLFATLLGAGASAQSGIKTGSILIEEWRKNAYVKINRSANAQDSNEVIVKWLSENAVDWYDKNNEYPCLFEWHYKMARLRQKFVEESIEGKCPSIGYAFLVRLIEKMYIGPVFTTNFDDLVNESFHLFSERRPIVCAHDSSVKSLSLTSTRPKIIKLHGDYLFDNIKCTASDVSNLEQNMKDKFSSFLTEFGLILSGYSGRDKSIISILSDCLKQQNSLLCGLYWVFRPDSEVNEQVLDIIRHEKSFVVLSDGYDEFMSELYANLIGVDKPLFTSDYGLGIQNKVVRGFLGDNLLQSNSNHFLKASLEELRKMVTGGELSKLMRTITKENEGSLAYSDEELLRLLRIEQYIAQRDHNGAIKAIEEELKRTTDEEVKYGLHRRACAAHNSIGNKRGALSSATELTQMDIADYQAVLLKSSLMSEHVKRIECLQEYLDKVGKNHRILNRISQERIRHIKYGKGDDREKAEVLRILDESIAVWPSVDNNAYWMKLKFVHDFECKQKEDISKSIVETLIKQSPYSARTQEAKILVNQGDVKSQGDSEKLIHEMLDCYRKSYPKDKGYYFTVLTDACVEFNNPHYIVEIVKAISKSKSIFRDETYIAQIMQLQYDVFRDLSGAIEIGKRFLLANRSYQVEECLLNLLIAAKKGREAEASLERLQGTLDDEANRNFKSDIYASDGNFQMAIDELYLIADKEYFNAKYSSEISYQYLRMGNWEKAKEVESEFLRTVDHSHVYGVNLVNYNYSKHRLKAKISVDKLREVEEHTKDNSLIGVIRILCGDSENGLKMLQKEAEKRFSKADLYLDWPVLSEYKEQLIAMRENLLKNKRTIEVDLSLIE